MPDIRHILKRVGSIATIASQIVVIAGALVAVWQWSDGNIQKFIDRRIVSIINGQLANTDTELGRLKTNAAQLPQDGQVAELVDQMKYLEQYTVKKGTISYFDSADCPEGWNRADKLSGRYVVATLESHRYDVGKQVGSPLESEENRATGQHSHQTKNTEPACQPPNHNQLMGGGGCGFRHKWPHSKPDTGLKEGTNAPYILLTACKKT